MSEKIRGAQLLLRNLARLKFVSKVCRKRFLWLVVATGLLASAPPLIAQTVSLAWDPSEGTNVVAYQVYYGTASGDYSVTTNVGPQTTAVIPALQSGITYFFAVTALDDIGLESLFSNEVSFQVPLTNPPPTIVLTAPANGSSYVAPATIGLTASVTANGNVISKVQFYNGTTLLGEDASAPYSFNWSNVGAGNYNLRAQAVYGSGSLVSSSSASVSVGNPPPTIALTAPANGSSYVAPATINLTASVTANGNPISKVQFYNGTTLLGEDASAPYSFSWSNVSAGNYNLRAQVVYGSGSVVSSTSASVSVGNPPPTIALTAPANGLSYVAPATINLTASVTANGNPISKVQFYNGTMLLGEDASAPYSFSWSNVSAGNYSLRAEAVYGSGNTVASTIASITVTGLPAPWETADIGVPGLAGSASEYDGIYTVAGAGTVGGTADQFHYVYQTLSGDGEILVQLNSIGTAGNNPDTGVMIRENLTAGSRFAFIGLLSNGKFQWMERTSTAGRSVSKSLAKGTPPNAWLRLVRSGNTISGYRSTDGGNWIQVSSATLSTAGNIYIGLAVSSGSATVLNTSSFNRVMVIP